MQFPLAYGLKAAAALVRAVAAGRSLTDALPKTPPALRPMAQALAYTALRRWGTVRAVRARLVPRAPEPALAALLDVALALAWPDPAPPYADHTLVDQAVTAAGKAGGFVNAVLRRFIRERASLVAAALADGPEARWNLPPWWVARLHADWGPQAEALLATSHQHAPMALRVNPRRCAPAAYQTLLPCQPAPVLHGLAAPQALLLDAPRPVDALPHFAQGWVSVQDVAAQWAAPLLAPQDGERILDACAAPGGKTAHLLELADAEVLALDADARRLALVDSGLARLGLRATTRTADARDVASWWDGRSFDAILLDAPCSGSGVVRRHPDMAWLRRAADVDALARTQAELLAALWPLLRPGGRLLYATCSVFKAEGEAQVAAFVAAQPQGTVRQDARAPGHALPLADNGRSPADGFYYALLHKTT
ncbi:MAG: 16S rRNA (cytosine(967)-C(5))-methyltransferase RsmB [Proteobacteria bacterium]|nr:16S rRNA (cytosine(967)-C(5))-methyltransferase RsmB [Pseudomonadota bacterium]